MDLSTIITSPTGDCVIVDPYDNKETDIIITMYGPYSDEYEAAFKKDQAREESNPLELLIDLTSDWINLAVDGKELDFSRENAEIVYSMEGKIVKRQAERFVLNTKNFLPKR